MTETAAPAQRRTGSTCSTRASGKKAAATDQLFRSLNTVAAWQAASEQARVPLGRMLSRQLLSEADVPAPPKGYRMVRFRTDFENKRGATETVSLDREGDSWKVVGIYIQ